MDAALPGYEEQWWRALAVFRTFSVLYAALLYAFALDDYRHVTAGWLVLAGLGAWTVLAFAWYRRPAARRWPLLTADLLVAAAAIVATRPLQFETAGSAQTLPVIWVGAPVVAWALVYGWAAAVPTSAVIGLAYVAERGAVTPALLHNTVLVLVAGATVGYACGLARRSERRLAALLRDRAAAQERDRLARELAAAVAAALDNVERHAGVDARAYVLLDDDGAEVSVVVRDTGPGFPPGRLAAAAAEGRLGVARSLSGRLSSLGGSALVTSTPGDGVEVTLRLPRRAAALARRSAS